MADLALVVFLVAIVFPLFGLATIALWRSFLDAVTGRD